MKLPIIQPQPLICDGCGLAERLACAHKQYQKLVAEDMSFEVTQLKAHVRILLHATGICNDPSRNCILRKCTCGREYRPSEWFDLPLVGYYHDHWASGEMRNCPCNSSLLVLTRKGEPQQPRSDRLQGSILDESSDLNQVRFSTDQFLNLVSAHQRSNGQDLILWEEKEVLDATG